MFPEPGKERHTSLQHIKIVPTLIVPTYKWFKSQSGIKKIAEGIVEEDAEGNQVQSATKENIDKIYDRYLYQLRLRTKDKNPLSSKNDNSEISHYFEMQVKTGDFVDSLIKNLIIEFGEQYSTRILIDLMKALNEQILIAESTTEETLCFSFEEIIDLLDVDFQTNGISNLDDKIYKISRPEYIYFLKDLRSEIKLHIDKL